MSSATPVKDSAPAPAPAAHEESHPAHPTDSQYILIALGLGVLTAIEVGVYYLKAGAAITIVLIVLMVLKFAIVVAFFMHLRFDSVVLRRLFITGLVLAVFIYSIVLFTFGIYHV